MPFEVITVGVEAEPLGGIDAVGTRPGKGNELDSGNAASAAGCGTAVAIMAMMPILGFGA